MRCAGTPYWQGNSGSQIHIQSESAFHVYRADARKWIRRQELARVALGLVHPRFLRKVVRLGRPRSPYRGGRWFIDPAFARWAKPPPFNKRSRIVDVRRTQLFLLRRGHLSQRMEGEAASRRMRP